MSLIFSVACGQHSWCTLHLSHGLRPPHLYVHAVPALVLTLHHVWGEGLTSCGASDTLELRDGAGAPRRGVAAPVQSQHLDFPQQHATCGDGRRTRLQYCNVCVFFPKSRIQRLLMLFVFQHAAVD